jgi:hypothetical protein
MSLSKNFWLFPAFGEMSLRLERVVAVLTLL